MEALLDEEGDEAAEADPLHKLEQLVAWVQAGGDGAGEVSQKQRHHEQQSGLALEHVC